jgi:hypothetical protein
MEWALSPVRAETVWMGREYTVPNLDNNQPICSTLKAKSVDKVRNFDKAHPLV